MSISPSARSVRYFHSAKEHLAFAADLAGQPDRIEKRREDISKWSVGDHLEHLAVTDAAILKGLEKILVGAPETTKPRRLSFAGRIFMTVTRIPRGRGKAPERLRPKGVPAAELAKLSSHQLQHLNKLGTRLEELDSAPGSFPHPIFGRLSAVDWLHFFSIHHRHHERIVRDILR